ncbi:prepilin-type N-terminal cleavage/methylation domain-containing protein [Bacillus sp. FJAT-27245]|uniref:prepilin-type N-terminal cleavage/methylation domain-containing protein n=1 Tax=Bacillus sp. FJAT-27245 TaxID=1684144 RepID=UPI0006A7DD27|nr:prepilin-type N-terminal cleavage/methylation domain-containing protein [Bacillus sp. FJAT-27245]
MRNNKGMTLIELLAALSILAIVSGLVYGVLVGANNNYNRLSSKAELSREANLILSTIKNYHEQTAKTPGNPNAEYEINVVSGQYVIGEKNNASTPLHSQNAIIEIRRNEILITGKETISSLAHLPIKITAKDKNGQAYEVDTIIRRY